QLSAASEDLKALETPAADLDALSAERSAAAAALEQAAAAVRLAGDAAAYRASIEEASAKLSERQEYLETADRIRVESLSELSAAELAAEAIRDQSDALRLASKLQASEPCPVCGSLDHGSHARPAWKAGVENPVADSQNAEHRLVKARTATGAAEREAAAAAARLDETRRALDELECRGDAFAEAIDSGIAETTRASVAARLAAAEAALSEETARAKAAARARSAFDAIRQKYDEATAAEAREASALAAAEASAAEAATGAGGEDPTAALASLEKRGAAITAERTTLEHSVAAWRENKSEALAASIAATARQDRARAATQEAEARAAAALLDSGFPDEESWHAALMPPADIANARTAIANRVSAEAESLANLSAAKRAVEGAKRPDMAAVAELLASALKARDAARAAVDEAAATERDLSTRLAALISLREERAALRANGERLNAMARLLNGDTGGRHLSFKTFVLSSYFATVVDRASARLREMSDNRYDMRVTEGRAGRGRVGLDLEVLDAFTGVARPASSLSGGEKFLASLSLALGLSEVIVARAGGVALDSIFIDEGFGSLDDETLDRAMAALERVRGERVIGIVSHVAELRSRIPARVEVYKSKGGSTLRVVC
ncbi:MAG: hypothetical protein JXM71_04830, partial [Spirochaetales bacterium]|nr:hypothetical protein [Spirochaetales bacterium]